MPGESELTDKTWILTVGEINTFLSCFISLIDQENRDPVSQVCHIMVKKNKHREHVTVGAS